MSTTPIIDSDQAVSQRYAGAAQQREAALCCPVQYDTKLLEVIPDEVIERDYGCGDPTPFVRIGDTVLDLGSGGGKLCFISAQMVGPEGRVIGVDCNPEMLHLARKHAPTVAERIGYANVEFRNGMIQDLQLDLDQLATILAAQPASDLHSYHALRHATERIRSEHPLLENDSVDCILSNCVLNLVRLSDRRPLFAEMFRVLRPGGRVAISDIVSDESVPESLKKDPNLWSGCISGAFREDEFLNAFADAGFHGIEIVKRQAEPWQTVEGIEFRSLTVMAYKGKQGPCLERNQAVIYRGPFSKVNDDDGHTYHRGERMAVCDKTFRLLQSEPYAEMFDAVEPRETIPLDDAEPFACRGNARRHPRQSKGLDYDATTEAPSDCGDDCC
ncbi:methyltransferase domain-containing protein [Bremerella alba]|uniref:Arsenite methyltransferase n=1 Tax=Bremerella alba TaxID=980252 RepID=A0A7V8V3M5_9BACT|nr:methyltransferase domain-containing protein [Bremerella alba]MBA2114176.1 Arsenite methyltransferase [Bremerella alba]